MAPSISLLINHCTMEGFVVFDYLDRFDGAAAQFSSWYAAGKLKTREDVAENLDNLPETPLELFRGQNLGKLVLKV